MFPPWFLRKDRHGKGEEVGALSWGQQQLAHWGNVEKEHGKGLGKAFLPALLVQTVLI